MSYQQKIFTFALSTLFIYVQNIYGQTDGIGLYSRRYEKLDVDTILSNPRLVTNYVDCLLNKRPCPPEGKDLKRILPEALRTKCSRCWPSQKEGALKVITKLYYDYPQHYNALREKWDPTGEYHRRFEEYLRDQNFNAISNDIDRDESIVLPSRSITSSTTTTPTSSVPSQSSTSSSPSSLSSSSSGLLPSQQPSEFTSPQTQRPTRQDAQESQDVFISNRFGDDENEFEDMTKKQQPPRTPAPTPKPATMRTTTSRFIYYNMQQQPYFGGTASVNVFKTQNPILNFINKLTTKFATTAEIIAGMFRGNCQQQQHQQFIANNMALGMD